MYIRQSDLEKFGYTGGCEACAAIREGRERQGINHNEKCRARIQEALKETSQGQARLERETQRETEYTSRRSTRQRRKRGKLQQRKKEGRSQEAQRQASPANLAGYRTKQLRQWRRENLQRQSLLPRPGKARSQQLPFRKLLRRASGRVRTKVTKSGPNQGLQRTEQKLLSARLQIPRV